jgi:hypothetical protein
VYGSSRNADDKVADKVAEQVHSIRLGSLTASDTKALPPDIQHARHSGVDRWRGDDDCWLNVRIRPGFVLPTGTVLRCDRNFDSRLRW